MLEASGLPTVSNKHGKLMVQNSTKEEETPPPLGGYSTNVDTGTLQTYSRT